MRLEQREILGESYAVDRKIGAGSFGQIYLGIIFFFMHINNWIRQKYNNLERSCNKDGKHQIT